MRLILSLLLFVGVAWSNSTSYYGWKPNKEFVYHFESQVLSGIPAIKDSQYAGVRLSSHVRVQTFPDYSLRIKFENVRYLTLNGEVRLTDSGRIVKESKSDVTEQGELRESDIPSEFRKYLETPFLVHLKRGVVESFFVKRSEPTAVINIKKAFLSKIQMDITGMRRSEIEFNHIVSVNGMENEDSETPIDSLHEVTFFSTREEGILGDCHTSYNIHQIPEYRAIELEREWREERQKLLIDDSNESSGEEICRGKQYYRITKNKNFDDCLKRPVYQKWVGLQSKCDITKATCMDMFTQLASTTYVVCGEIEDFVIRKISGRNTILTTPTAWNTKEKIRNMATVTINLLKEEESRTPMTVPTDTVEVKSLLFGFEHSSKLSLEERQQKFAETGIYPSMPKPSLRSRISLPFVVPLTKEEVTRQTIELLNKISHEVFESPESCSSNSDVAGHLSILSKYLIPLSLDELKHLESEVMRSLSGKPEETRTATKSLFYDVLASVGTNPSVMLVKELIQEGKVTGRMAISLLQSTLRSIKTPTEELLKELVQLVKHLNSIHWQRETVGFTTKDLYTVGLLHLSKLMYRSCVHPVYSVTEFPVHMYGYFCSNTSTVITHEWIPYLESIVEGHGSSQDEHFRLVSISALGKLGHIKSLTPLVKIISGELTTKPLIRSVAVYSLKRIGRLNPTLIKPVLLAVIDNPAENVEVRIAAVSVLPWCQPTMTQLQKIAVRSWFEPSKQVSAFIYSTFKSLSNTEIPELRSVGRRATSLLHLIKPIEYGVQFSHNVNYAVFVDYLKTVISKKFSWVSSEDQIVPTKFAYSGKIFSPSMVARCPSFSVYTQGMDFLLDKFLYFPKDRAPVSESVRSQLDRITEELKIMKRKELPVEAFIQWRAMGFESMYTLNKEYIMEFLEKTTDSLRYQSHGFTEGKRFELTRKIKAFEMEHFGPTAAGFLLYSERSLPVVFSVRGTFKTQMSSDSSLPIPTMVEASVTPIMNVKLQSFVGVLSPFTNEMIGSGVAAASHITLPIEVKIELTGMGQVSVAFKTPETIRKEIEVMHAYVKPFTVKKNLKFIRPFCHSKSVKVIYSGEDLKKFNYDLKRSCIFSGKLTAESDNRFTDLYSYIEKVRQHTWYSLPVLGLLPSTMRYSSTKLRFNPSESETKEIVVRFSLTKVMKNSMQSPVQYQYPESYSDELMIKKVCKETYPSSMGDYERCRVQLKSLEDVSTEARRNCERFSFHNPEDRERCYKTAQICEKAVEICESHHGPISSKCHENKQVCYQRLVSSHRSSDILNQIGGKSQVQSLRIESEFKGSYSSKSAVITLHLGSKEEEYGHFIKSYASMEIDSSDRSTYEFIFDGETKLPMIKNRWNKEKLLNEDIKLEFDGKFKYGVRGGHVKEIVVKGSMEKSAEQKESVRKSVEYHKCSTEESRDWWLSPICMKVRHEAASLDKFVWTVQVPEQLKRCYAVETLIEMIKSAFLTQTFYEPGSSSVSSDKEVRVVMEFSRNGDEAQVYVEQQGLKWNIKNIRVHKIFKGVFPLSVRNHLFDRLVQKVTHNQSPASCRIEPTYVGTFDNRTYHYEMNSCWHLLFKDCHGKLPVAVLSKGLSDSSKSKEVKILSGLTEVTMKPKSDSSEPTGMDVVVKVNGQSLPIELTPGKWHVERSPEGGHPLFEIKMYHDMVYRILFYYERLEVITDGVRVEVIAPQMTRTRACGMCGDLNGENTADLKTPGQCLLKKDRYVAYSYMLPGGEIQDSDSGSACSGIPSSERSEYEREIRECVKKHEVITPLKEMYHRLFTLSKPLISVHLIEKRPNQLCISKQKINICVTPAVSSHQKDYLEGSKPSVMQRRYVKFTCFRRPSLLAYTLEKRARSGEGLQDELIGSPVFFSKVVHEPISCKN